MAFPKLISADGAYKADYIFFDKTNNGLKRSSRSFRTQEEFDKVEDDKKNWELIKSEDGFFLYRRKGKS